VTRLAIVGAGIISGYHARALQGLADARVTWVADQDLERARALAAELGARATADNDEALGASDVDAVLVAVPTPFHRPVVELAAVHGKHVLCEKPIARSVEDAEAMIAACAAAGARLMVGQVVRFFPEYARIKTVLDEGTLGPIGLVRSSRVGSSPGLTRAWIGDLALSGGVVVDLMIHELDTLRWYFGDLARVFAHGLSYSPYQATADHAQALLRFESGVVAHVEASWAHAAFRTTLEIAGEHGIVRHDSEEVAPLRYDLPAEGTSPPRVERRGAISALPYRLQLRHFIDRLRDGEPFLTPGEEGLRALEAALAVLASVRSGRPVHFAGGRPPREAIAA
jgi:predicted dehydrogenase